MKYSKEIRTYTSNFGAILAIVISWSVNKSIFWAIVHGFFSWFYVLYYMIRNY